MPIEDRAREAERLSGKLDSRGSLDLPRGSRKGRHFTGDTGETLKNSNALMGGNAMHFVETKRHALLRSPFLGGVA